MPLVLTGLYKVVDDDYEVIVVDDGSTDRTVEVANRFPCTVIRQPHNMGKGAAMRTGLLHAQGENAMFVDADNTYPMDAIPELLAYLGEYDMVRGIRMNGRQNIPALNRVGNLLFDSAIRMLHDVKGKDLLSGMFGGKRSKLLQLGLESEGFDVETETSIKAQVHGLTCATVPIAYATRVGEKKLKPFRDGALITRRILQLTFSYKPLLMFVLPGIVLLLLGVVGLVASTTFDVARGPIIGTSLGPDAFVQSLPFALGVVGAIGFQFVIFGVALYLAGLASVATLRKNRTLDAFVRSIRTPRFIVSGLVLFLIGIAGTIVGSSSFPLIEAPWLIVPSALLALVGLEMVGARAFLTALNRLSTRVPVRTDTMEVE